MLYRVAAYTGYRAGELAALVPACFNLDAARPTIDLDGKYTKNGKSACQPIPSDLANDLREYLRARPADRPVWPGTWSQRAADMIQADVRAAGLPITVDAKDGVQVLDFHSLRGTFATLLDGLDISLKARQELMRHSDPRLTLNTYTRAKLHDLGAAVDKLPRMGPTAPESEPAVLRATGTDNGSGREQQGAATGAAASGFPRLRLRADENIGEGEGDPEPTPRRNEKPLVSQGFEEDSEALKTAESGEGGRLLGACRNKIAPSHLWQKVSCYSRLTSNQQYAAVIGDSQEWSA